MEVHGSESLFKGCLLSPKAWRWWQPEGLPAFFFLSLYLSCAKYTYKHTTAYTYMCTNTQLHTLYWHVQTKKPTHTTSASQLASALIPPWKRIIFLAGCFFFVYCEPTKALSAANHCMSKSDVPQSLKKNNNKEIKMKGLCDNLLEFRLPFSIWTITNFF